jgi:hypothetical protein
MLRTVLTRIAALLLVISPAQALAQGRVAGRAVDDASGAALPGVRITFRSAEGRLMLERVTDSVGAFEFAKADFVSGRLQADLLGYKSATTPLLDLRSDQSDVIEIRLSPDPLPLDSVDVTAEARRTSPVLDAFYDRVGGGLGYFITREDISRRRPLRTSDLIASAPGVRLESSGSGQRRIATMSRATGRCRAEIFVDGMHVTRWAGSDGGVSVDEVASPGVIEGIEVYTGGVRAPAEFRSAGGECGVIAIWTRRGDAE